MGFVADAVAVSDLIGKALKFTQQSSWRLYKASTDRQVFQNKLTNLQNQSVRWTEDLRRYGLENDPEIRSLLKQACLLLDQEVAKNKELQPNWFWRLFTTLVFPEALTDVMDKVCSAFENLPELLADREARRQLLERAALNHRPILPFIADEKYVEFKTTIASVRRALEVQTRHRIVMLCGGPGQGKTSMAKHLALLYQNGPIAENPQVHVREEALSPQNSISKRLLHHTSFRCCGLLGKSVSQDESSDPNLATNVGQESLPAQDSVSRFFPERIFFYHCGRDAKSMDILLRLWGDLGYELHPRTRLVENSQDLASSSDIMQQSSSTEDLLNELMRRLANQKVLIVLDDVWHHMLIQEVLVQGECVKYLITTQNSKLWEDAVCVPMANPTFAEAHQILRNHVPGFPTAVTTEIEGALDAIIEKSAHNPLVLANVATYVRRADDLKEWKSAKIFLEDPLFYKSVQLSSVMYGRTYSKQTMERSITMAVDSFSLQDQTLLFLASICEGQSIPEVVLKMFFKKIHGSLFWFSRCLEDLQRNNFVQIESKIVPWSEVPQRSWSLHGMRQQVIDETKSEEIRSLIEKLLESNTKDKIVVALLVLYGQQRWRDQATHKLMNSAELCKNNYLHSASSDFSTVKPFVWLLQGDGEEDWEKESDHLVEQVVHHYMVAGELDDGGVSTLLAMQQTMSYTTMALEKMSKLKDEPTFTVAHAKTAQALLNVLKRVTDNSITTGHTSAWLLSKFSFECLQHTIGLTSFPNLIESLGALLASQVSPNVQECASLALAYLSLKFSAYPINIASFPVALQRLVALLAQDMRPFAQGNAAATLGNLSSMKENAIEIASFPGAIKSLVALLAKHETPDVQENAAYALGWMSRVAENDIKIGYFPSAIDGLVALLAKDMSTTVQQKAAWALGSLCLKSTEISTKIASCPNAVDGLVALLGKDVNPAVQQKAALALGNLSGSEAEIDLQISSCPCAIDGLVALLGKEVTPAIQKNAAYALGSLCLKSTEISTKIASCPNAIDGLVALLGNDMSRAVQENATLALGELSGAEVEIDLQILTCPGAIVGLVALLEKDVMPAIQRNAAYALGSLCLKSTEVPVKIASCPNAINALVALLGKDVSLVVQEHAAWALGNLSGVEAEIDLQISTCPSAIDGLVALLGKDMRPAIQENSAWALGRLCLKSTEVPVKIASCPDAIDGLVTLLGKDMSPAVQEHAALALGSLSGAEAEIDLQISLYPGAIDRLVALLDKDVSPLVQENAAYALGNLCLKSPEISTKIASCPNAIDGLVALLDKDVNLAVQERAALALGNLSSAEVEIDLRISTCSGAIDRLVALLGKDMSPAIQENAAWALGRLCLKSSEIPVKIASCPNAIDGLVALLAKDVSPTVQEKSAWALGQLHLKPTQIPIEIASWPGAVDRLVALLAEDVTPAIQE